jgi:hypothetical protein
LAEYWISFGFVAVVIGGWITGKFSRLSAPLFDSSGGTIGPVFYGYITMGLFASTRSLVDAILYSYVLLAWIAVNWMIEKYKN